MRHSNSLQSLLGGTILAGLMAFAPTAVSAGSHGSMEKSCFLGATMVEDGSASSTPSADALEDAFRCIAPSLMAGYGQSKHVLARTFGEWDAVSETPFVYDAIGQQYLMVFANETALGHEKTLWLDRGLPIGATLAAAGFSVNGDGMLQPEPLVLYEKMTNGFSFGRGNWRKTMIAPDGTIMGVTNGEGGQNITVCANCSAQTADRVYLTLLNAGDTPMGAPAETAPPPPGFGLETGDGSDIDEGLSGSSLGGGTGGGFGAPSPSLAPVEPLLPPSTDGFDPNTGLDPLAPLDPAPAPTPGAALDPLAPLDPSAPLDPLAPLDPNAPLDPLAPLEPLDPNASAAPPSGLENFADTGVTTDTEIPAIPSVTAEAPPALEPAEPIAEISRQGVLEAELADAVDPILIPPLVRAADPLPTLEPEITGS